MFVVRLQHVITRTHLVAREDGTFTTHEAGTRFETEAAAYEALGRFTAADTRSVWLDKVTVEEVDHVVVTATVGEVTLTLTQRGDRWHVSGHGYNASAGTLKAAFGEFQTLLRRVVDAS